MEKQINAAEFFDKEAVRYDEALKDQLGLSGDFDVSLFAEYKAEILRAKTAFEPVSLLEFGCGTGRNIPFLRRFFPQCKIFGCDVSGDSLKVAEERAIPGADFKKITAPQELASAYKDIDVVFVSNVFHHIPFGEHPLWMRALNEVLSGRGVMAIFEHNPFNPVTRLKTHREFFGEERWAEGFVSPRYCERLLKNAGFSRIHTSYTLFFLKRNAFLKRVEQALFWLPLGAQYFITAGKGRR